MRGTVRGLMVVALLAAIGCGAAVQAATFADVPRGHWAYPAIQAAVDAGILQGSEDKFHGERLMNRYQMAVVVDKLLKATAGAAPTGVKPAAFATARRNAEALALEFADELARLNVRVAQLDEAQADLAAQVTELRGGGDATGTGGFTGFASVGIISADDDAGQETRYLGARDQLSFELPQVSVGLDREVNPGLFFHAQFDYSSLVNATDGGVALNECYFISDQAVWKFGLKLGAFALPFSLEHNGPFRSLQYTITPSVANTYIESIRGYGVELRPARDEQPLGGGFFEDFEFRLGLVSNTDDFTPATAGLMPFALNDAPVFVHNGREADDSFGWYLWGGKPLRDDRTFGWTIGWFDNGGETNPDFPKTPSPSVDFLSIGFEWKPMHDFLLMAQVLDGETSFASFKSEMMAYYVLLNWKFESRTTASLRFDSWDIGAGGPYAEGYAYTWALNRQVTRTSFVQFEYLVPELETAPGGALEPEADLIQVRYKVHF